jgi:zinc and cadmium transporter
MSALLHSLIAVSVVSVISLVGLVTFSMRQGLLNRFLFIATALGAGSLLGAVMFDLLPEAVELTEHAFPIVLAGMLVFFVIERFIHWHHHHHHQHHPEEEKKIHPFVYLNLIGDAVHNFIDGALIAGSFMVNTELGIVTTIAVVFHEIPQEISDFGLLIAGGMNRMKALAFNFLSALTAVVGALAAYVAGSLTELAEPFLVAFAAGGFLYIAAADLMPELHKQVKLSTSIAQFASLLAGIAVIWLVNGLFHAAH